MSGHYRPFFFYLYMIINPRVSGKDNLKPKGDCLMTTEEKLIKKIEELRLALNEITKEKELSDPEVIIASQMLDAVLNEYHRILKRKLEE
jgi:stage 0 sporulation regulatory protein